MVGQDALSVTLITEWVGWTSPWTVPSIGLSRTLRVTREDCPFTHLRPSQSPAQAAWQGANRLQQVR